MQEFYEQSFFFQLSKQESEEIQKHKWVLSERAGKEVSYEVALFSWIHNHRAGWRKSQLENKPPSGFM